MIQMHKFIESIPLEGLQRIDVGLEGNWNPTVVTVWTREKGLIGFDGVTRTHPRYKPSLEFYYEGSWVGLHCFTRIEEMNVFDESLTLEMIRSIESRMP